jgi:RNA 3'-terminal phosphate cyclase
LISVRRAACLKWLQLCDGCAGSGEGAAVAHASARLGLSLGQLCEPLQMSSGVLRFEGSTHFRQRLVCSTLSGRPIRIDNIRGQDQAPGLRDFEACLLRLFEKITDGCVVEINETGALQGEILLAGDGQ